MSERKGYFVILEGNERTGKTTQLELVANGFRAKGYDVVTTREPGGTPFAEQLREMLLDNSDGKDLDPTTELLMFATARHDHYLKVIKPALEAGKVVVSSRGFFSTFALQVHPTGSEELMGLFNHVTGLSMAELGNVRPMIVNLTLSEEERTKRFTERPVEDAIESRDEIYQSKVQEAYDLLSNQPGTLSKDATTEPNQLAEEIVEELLVWFAEQDKRFEAEAITEDEDSEVAVDEATVEDIETEVSESEFVELSEVKEELQTELTRHGENLQAMIPEEQREAMSSEWNDQLSLLSKWIDIYIEETEEKAVRYTSEEAANTVQKISDNMGALLGSWLTMRNIQDMLDHKAKEA